MVDAGLLETNSNERLKMRNVLTPQEVLDELKRIKHADHQEFFASHETLRSELARVQKERDAAKEEGIRLGEEQERQAIVKYLKGFADFLRRCRGGDSQNLLNNYLATIKILEGREYK